MKKNWLKICVFISVALLLFNANCIFAYESADEALEDLKNNVKIVGLEQIVKSSEANEDEDITVKEDYFYRFDKGKYDEVFDSENGTVTIDGKNYTVGFGIKDGNGKIISIAEGIQLEDAADNAGENAYVSSIKSSIRTSDGETLTPQFLDGRTVYCYLKPTDGNDDSISISKEIGAFKLPTETIKYTAKERTDFGWKEGIKLWWNTAIRHETSEAKKVLTETLVSILLACGDSFLHLLSQSVGEVVTVDRIVFGNVNKVSIDFFDDLSNTSSGVMPLKSSLTSVINDWYAFFLKIAILFYCVLLVYMGLRILLASTGAKKAEYKTRLVAWTMGVAMLLCFPYVMKYTIIANQALCEWIAAEATDSQNGTPQGNEFNIAKAGMFDLMDDYGEYSFVAKAMGFNSLKSLVAGAQSMRAGNTFGNNIMLAIRMDAQMTFSLPLAIVYLIMLGQTMALVILYYKRVFMLAFLITIFPLAAMFYTLNKTGDVKINSFGSWFKEYVVNVFIQAFHAVTYVTVVTLGISAYKESGDWMFFILCVLFLFEGEKIIRAIFNAKSSAGTIGDMAAAGAMAFGILKKAADGVGKLPKGQEKGEDDSDTKKEKANAKAKRDVDKANQQVNQNAQTQGTEKNKAAAETAALSASSNGASGASSASQTVSSANTQVKLGREPDTTHEEVFSKVNKRIDERSATTASKAGKVIAGIAGGTGKSILSYSFAAAQTKDFKSAGNAIGVGISGATTGYTSGAKAYDSVHNFRQGRLARAEGLALADEYLNGDHDDDFVINEADEKLRKTKLEAYRKIAARVATERAKHGKDAAEKVIINESLDTK